MQINKGLFIVSFLEGASVMAAEICGAKLLAPFFGSSLYVWSSVMAVTLGGLASGYFLGGKFSKTENQQTTLSYVLIGAVIFLCLMPFATNLFYFTATYFSLLVAVFVSVMVLLFPTMLFMGATSPLIISLLTNNASQSGENSGKIYAVSTLGGIIATFLCGFYLIPQYGVTLTLLCFACLLLVSSLLIVNKKKSNYSIILIPITGLIYSFGNNNITSKSTIYQTDGIFGKLEIREEPFINDTSKTIRKLLINNIVQTEMDLDTKLSVSEYVNLVNQNISYLPKGKALVMGLGGGLVSNLLVKNNYSVTSIELDERVVSMANRFFYLDSTVKVICDDARHYLNTCHDKYNVVLFDIFKAEEQPSHVITKESLIKLKTLLDTNAVVLINTHGYLNKEKGLGTQCLLATLVNAGFNLKMCASSTQEDYRNLLIIASLTQFKKEFNQEFAFNLLTPNVINTDDKPILEKLNAPANQAWRSNYLRNYILTK